MSQIFADNLRHLMQSTGIKNVNDLSRRVRIAQPTLFRWLAAESREPRHSSIMPIADYFGVTIDDLLTRDLRTGEKPRLREAIGRAHVPVVPWKDVKYYQDVMNSPGVETWPSIHVKLTKRAFATKVEGNSMSPLIPDGAMIIVEPDRAAKNGDVVLVVEPDHHTTVVRRMEVEAGICYLVAERLGFETIRVHGEPQILGVVREVQQITKL
jgi:transcriptional regulator with XRE-family HTH domain